MQLISFHSLIVRANLSLVTADFGLISASNAVCLLLFPYLAYHALLRLLSSYLAFYCLILLIITSSRLLLCHLLATITDDPSSQILWLRFLYLSMEFDSVTPLYTRIWHSLPTFIVVHFITGLYVGT